MKKIKQIAIIIMISLVLQLFIFAMLDLKAEQLLNPSFRFDKAYDLNADLSEARGLSLSYNNRFLAYIAEDNLEIIDLTNNKVILTRLPPQAQISLLAYKWLPDRNGIVYLVQNSSDYNSAVSLFSLDLDNSSPSDPNFPPEPKLDRVLNLSIQEIISLEVSTYTNNLYLLYRTQDQNTRLITIDIMKNINRSDKAGENILAIAVSNKFGNVYVESKNEMSKAIFAVKGREWSLITENCEDILLGCQDNLIYIGRIEERSLRQIFFYTQGSQDTVLTKEINLQGDIQLKQKDVLISTDHKVLHQSSDTLDIIYPDGRYISKKIGDKTIVLSPTGKMYLEISPSAKKYYWRPI